jgi:hypothetical protein
VDPVRHADRDLLGAELEDLDRAVHASMVACRMTIHRDTAGRGRERRALAHLRQGYISPIAVAVGVTSYAVTALLSWWIALPALAGLLTLMVVAAWYVDVDRLPPARLLPPPWSSDGRRGDPRDE